MLPEDDRVIETCRSVLNALMKIVDLLNYIYIFFFYPMPHMSFTDFVVLPPGHGRSVTDF